MRRKMGRVTDVEWLVRNAEYAQEIIRLACQQTEHPEVADWGAKLRAMLFPRPAAPAPAPGRAEQRRDGGGALCGRAALKG